MSRLWILWVLGACWLGPVAGMAEEPGAPLTVQAAVELAITQNPQMLVALAERDELKGLIKEVRSRAFPQVNVEAYALRLRDPSILNSSSFDKLPPEFVDALTPSANNMFSAGVTVKQPIYTAGKVRNALKLAKESLLERDAASEAVRQQLTFSVLEAFNNLHLAIANLEVVRETQQQRKKHLEQARIRFNSGVATEIDVLRSQVNVANMEPDVIRAENRVRLARAGINNLIVVDLDAPTVIAGTLEYRPWPNVKLADMQVKALQRRPELEASRRQVEEARITLALANAEKKLSIDFDGQWGSSVREPQNMFDYDFSRYNLSFNFKLPVFDSGRKAGLVMQAKARLRAAEQRLAQLENSCKLEVKQAYDDMQSAAEAIAAALLSVSQAEKVLTMMQSNYQYGAATTLDVSDSQTALAEARNARIGATYIYEMAKARLRLASGSPILDSEGDQ
jgi:outer membrane protein TolC